MRSAVRFLAEVVAWVLTPWAIAPHSIVLAIAAVVLLIGIPTVFGTPGDRPNVLVAVPGRGTIGINILEFAAAVGSAWFAWPAWAAVLVTVGVLVAAVLQVDRWRRLATAATAV
jgi:hypothetical protein